MTGPVPDGHTYIDSGVGRVSMRVGELHMLAAHTIKDKMDALGDALDKIVKAMESLQISWSGDAEQEAQQLLDHWAQVSKSIFGTTDDPERGVLNRIVESVRTAAYTYNQSEVVVQQSWTKLHDELMTILAGGTPSSDGGPSGDLTPPIVEV